MRPEHLDLLNMCGTPTVHPDGRLAIVSVIRPDLDSNDYVGTLWSVPLDDSGPPRRLTRGHRDTAPAISPDGAMVAFLRSEKKGKPQLHVVEVGGGEPVLLTDAALGAGAPSWSPDSRRIAFAARVPEQGRYGTDEDIPADAEAPRLITKLAYRMDGNGYTNDRRHHLFVLDVPDLDTLDPAAPPVGGLPANRQRRDPAGSEPGGLPANRQEGVAGEGSAEALSGEADPDANVPEARQITDGDCDDMDVSWSPDGTRLVFMSDRGSDGAPRQYEDLTSSIFTCTPDGADRRFVAGTGLSCESPQWTHDAEFIVFLASEVGTTGFDFVARNTSLYAVPVPSLGDSEAAGGDQQRLTDADSIDLGETGSHLSVSRRGVIVQDRSRGAVRLLEIDPSAGPVDATSAVEIAGGTAWHRGHAVTPSGEVVVAAVAECERPSDLVLVRGSGGDIPRQLTDVGRRLREAAHPRQPLDKEIPSSDGYPVHGWAILPDPAVRGPGPYPVLLNIHGGPYASSVASFFDEPQIYAGAGYAVLMCNPRGSAGYGQEHGRAIKGAMGTVDAQDILAFLDGCLADPELPLDADRVGVMGGSYGGYMTAWLTTRTDRFAAAIVERGYLDAVSFIGSSDIGWFFPDGYHRADSPVQATFEGPGRADRQARNDSPGSAEGLVAGEASGAARHDTADLWDQSPMAYVDRVTTPTLVVHSEADWRTPIEQGQRWYAALRRNGVPAELLIFPGEGHEMSRSGRPSHRRDRFVHILRWWAEHLPVTAPPA